MTTLFYYCEHCGNVIIKLHDGGPVPVCCGETMTRLTPNLIDPKGETAEKHIPVCEKLDDCSYKVKVGSKPHPMTDVHRIEFLFIETADGGQFIRLKPEDMEAEAVFCACREKPVAVYAYCNIHGLWKLDCGGGMQDSCTDKKECCKTGK